MGLGHLSATGALPTVAVLPDNVLEASCEELVADIEVLEELGAGSFGVVHKGLYQGAEVAIKVLMADALHEAVVREILLAPQLNHPNVIKTYTTRCATLTQEFLDQLNSACWSQRASTRRKSADKGLQRAPSNDGFGPARATPPLADWKDVFARLGAQPGKRVLLSIQEVASGGNLTRPISRRHFDVNGGSKWAPRIARRALLRTAVEIARGMIHLHSSGVVHGDLKPANVLLCAGGRDVRGYTAKIADFGLAHVIGDNSMVLPASPGGTVAYMAPEHVDNKLCKATDVYSFGMTLNEIVTGKRPYDRMPHAQIVVGVSCLGLRPDWPDADWPELSALGRSCLAQEPGDRPSFVELEQMLVEMDDAMRAESREVPPPPPTPHAARASCAPAFPCPGGVATAPSAPTEEAGRPAPAADQPSCKAMSIWDAVMNVATSGGATSAAARCGAVVVVPASCNASGAADRCCSDQLWVAAALPPLPRK